MPCHPSGAAGRGAYCDIVSELRLPYHHVGMPLYTYTYIYIHIYVSETWFHGKLVQIPPRAQDYISR